MVIETSREAGITILSTGLFHFIPFVLLIAVLYSTSLGCCWVCSPSNPASCWCWDLLGQCLPFRCSASQPSESFITADPFTSVYIFLSCTFGEWELKFQQYFICVWRIWVPSESINDLASWFIDHDLTRTSEYISFLSGHRQFTD